MLKYYRNEESYPILNTGQSLKASQDPSNLQNLFSVAAGRDHPILRCYQHNRQGEAEEDGWMERSTYIQRYEMKHSRTELPSTVTLWR